MKVLIRKIEHSDYLQIIDLYNEENRKNVMYHDIVGDKNRIIIVAIVDKSIIGFAQINFIKNEIENYKYSFINNICLKDKYKTKTILKLMLDTCKKLGIENNCNEMSIQCDDTICYKAFKQLGFDSYNVNLLSMKLH